jgi:hypothetical protein
MDPDGFRQMVAFNPEFSINKYFGTGESFFHVITSDH